MAKKQPPEWKEVTVKLKDLSPYPENPRYADADGVNIMDKSLKTQGYHDRIKINIDNVMLGGHLRHSRLIEEHDSWPVNQCHCQ